MLGDDYSAVFINTDIKYCAEQLDDLTPQEYEYLYQWVSCNKKAFQFPGSPRLHCEGPYCHGIHADY